MSVFTSKLNSSTEEYAKNRREMLALVDEMRTLEARAVAASHKRLARFEERGQLAPRARLEHLLDPGMPFLEL